MLQELKGLGREGRMDVDPSGGEELEELAQKVMAQPADVIERVKKLLGN